jgi:pimeloyl-ACP methyl ester carboxylesterase
MPPSVVVVHGTFGRSQGWHREGSPLWTALVDRGFRPIRFLWSGVLAGVPTLLSDCDDELFGQAQLLPWLCAGEKLELFCRVNGLERPHVVCHSHGLQVLSFAAALGQRFDTVLSLSGPIRGDMQAVRQAARPNINRLVHTFDPAGDRTIREGMWFDGRVSTSLELPEADLNIPARGYGHSGLTTAVTGWSELDLWDYFSPPIPSFLDLA